MAPAVVLVQEAPARVVDAELSGQLFWLAGLQNDHQQKQ